tara:strand:- start:40 stop:828 length:789 start_codon:yes stop_codon:yes gene_type:complete
MKVLQNSKLNEIPLISQNVDNLSNLPYVVAEPLAKINDALYIVGCAGSGKTNLMLSLLKSHPTKKKPNTPRFYYKYFDKVFLCSPSTASMNLDQLGLNDERIHQKYSDEMLEDIITTEQEDENNNSLLILDDVITQIKRSHYASRILLNRRHCMTNPDEEGSASLSIWICSQKFNALPLLFRNNMSSFVIFRTDNQKEKECIREELMADLNKSQQDEIFKLAWDQKYSFLYIRMNKDCNHKYHQRFNRIIINENEENDKIEK